jgi:hypothetical protein
MECIEATAEASLLLIFESVRWGIAMAAMIMSRTTTIITSLGVKPL